MDALSNDIYLGGLRSDASKWYWTVAPFIPSNEVQIPVRAVCTFLQPEGARAQLVIIKNARGYDIPGGHVQSAEDWSSCLYREIREECAAEIVEAHPVCLLISNLHPEPQGLIIYSSVARLATFSPTAEIAKRCIMTPKVFLKHYCGNRFLMEALMRQAKLIG